MQTKMLKGILKTNGLTQQETASGIGLCLSRFNAKLNASGGAEFTQGEICRLKRLLGLTPGEVDLIFFT